MTKRKSWATKITASEMVGAHLAANGCVIDWKRISKCKESGSWCQHGEAKNRNEIYFLPKSWAQLIANEAQLPLEMLSIACLAFISSFRSVSFLFSYASFFCWSSLNGELAICAHNLTNTSGQLTSITTSLQPSLFVSFFFILPSILTRSWRRVSFSSAATVVVDIVFVTAQNRFTNGCDALCAYAVSSAYGCREIRPAPVSCLSLGSIESCTHLSTH